MFQSNVITNINSDPLKYLGHELGTNTKTTGKGNDIQHVIMGSFNDDELAKLLDK